MKKSRIAEAVLAVPADSEATAKRPRLPVSSAARAEIWLRYGAMY
jgi:hypothetical protein